MTEPDIIRLEGVLYDVTEMGPSYGGQGEMYICARPKRKQTGWICRQCRATEDSGVCVEITKKTDMPPERRGVDIGCFGAVWEPFHGKVVEE